MPRKQNIQEERKAMKKNWRRQKSEEKKSCELIFQFEIQKEILNTNTNNVRSKKIFKKSLISGKHHFYPNDSRIALLARSSSYVVHPYPIK